jgi:hypothetical protein
MKKIAVACAVLIGAGAISSCSESNSGSPDPASATTVTATATVTATVTPSPATKTLQLGESSNYDWGHVTVLKVDQDVPVADANLPGAMTWMGLLVRTCVTGKQRDGKPTTLGWGAWTVADKSDGQYDSFAWTGVSYPTPTYPIDRAVAVGQCVRGWIIFNKPQAVRPMSAAYAPTDTNPAVWRFK